MTSVLFPWFPEINNHIVLTLQLKSCKPLRDRLKNCGEIRRIGSSKMSSNNVGFSVSAAKEESPCRVTLEDFERIKFLGEGGFGRVYLVRKRGGVDNGTLYALKVMQK
jgi:hypothetical protein